MADLYYASSMPTRKPSRRTLRVVDLFCGCGGLSVGFELDNCRILGGVDADEAALRTFQKNFPAALALNCDLAAKGVGEQIRKRLGSPDVDVVVAGPPCQGFSLTGPRQFEDPRNRLYMAAFDVVRALAPKAFVIENVRGMASLYNGQVKAEVIRRFGKLGYNTVAQVLCAADFGVPQFRYRLFFVGLREEFGTFVFPTPTHGASAERPWITCSDAISDLPALAADDLGSERMPYEGPAHTPYQAAMRRHSDEIANHVATRHTELVRSVIALVPAGGDHRDLPPGVGEHRRFNEAWTRYHPDKPSHTIDTGHRNHFHYQLNRVPTVRENARLQSFPDRFHFVGTRTQQNRQVGNAVPPYLAQAISVQLRRWI